MSQKTPYIRFPVLDKGIKDVGTGMRYRRNLPNSAGTYTTESRIQTFSENMG